MDTYAKVFRQMYTGSMYGAGLHVFAVWGWMLANKDAEGHVEVNPVMVANMLGGLPEDVQEALAYLLKPDPASRAKEHDGRRVIKIGEYEYEIVNHAKYRDKASKDNKRQADRERIADKRAKNKDVAGCRKTSQPVADVAYTDTKPNTDTVGIAKPTREELGLKATVREKATFLSEQLTRLFHPGPRSKATLSKAVAYLIQRAESDPSKEHWLTDAVEWARIAHAEASKPAAMWVAKVKQVTGFNQKLLSD